MIALYFISEGRIVSVEFEDKRDIARVMKYMTHVQAFIGDGDTSWLAVFRGRAVQDARMKRWILETRPDVLRQLVNPDGSINT
jgi:hypothetical protein